MKKFDFVQILHDGNYLLAQVVELERDADQTIADCSIIGYSKGGKPKQLRTPPQPGSEVLKAEDTLIKIMVQLPEGKKGAYIGTLEGKDIPIYLDLQNLLTKHIAILAKSGSGKSYTVGVLLEEMLQHNIPLIVIDPHGEYLSLRLPNTNKADVEKLHRSQLNPKGFSKKIVEYGDGTLHPNAKPLKLNVAMEGSDLVSLLPGKLTQNQIGLLYSAFQHLKDPTFESLLQELELADSQSKWGIISRIDVLRKLNIFSIYFTPYAELIRSGYASIINLKGIAPEVQEIIVTKLLSDLFTERKKGTIPPFFAVIEESHTFMPERNFGEAKSSKILRTVASEGRKFGMGLCVVSQRPARIDKSVLSQCGTQIILKLTNPGDVKAVSASVEGITLQSEAELSNLPVGTALIAGIVDLPLVVDIRPRLTEHGGTSTSIVQAALDVDVDVDVETELEEHEHMLPLIRPKLSPKDMQLMEAHPITIDTYLIPALLYTVVQQGNEFRVLVELTKGRIITNIDDGSNVALPPTNQEGFSFSPHAFYGKIEYGTIEADKKLAASARPDLITQRISSMAEVKNKQECFIVWYIGK